MPTLKDYDYKLTLEANRAQGALDYAKRLRSFLTAGESVEDHIEGDIAILEDMVTHRRREVSAIRARAANDPKNRIAVRYLEKQEGTR